MAGRPAETWQTAGYSWQTDCTLNQQCPRKQGQVQYAPQANSCEHESGTVPSTMYSLPFNHLNGLVAVNPSFEAPTTDIDWQVSGFNSESKSIRHDKHGGPPPTVPYDTLGTNTPRSSNFAQNGADDFVPNKSDPSCLLRNGVLKEYHESTDFRLAHSPSIASNCGETIFGGPYSATSPPPHALGWLPVADSTYGSESSHAECMMQAPHYFFCSEVENSPSEKNQASSTVVTKSYQQPRQEMGAETAAKTFHAEQTRMRQDAHSKVEKRYRMNINSKIEQLRRILPNESCPEHQSPNHSNASCSSRRRKSGTDLSKRDILSMTISHVEQLQSEVQHLTSENLGLKEELASMRSLISDEGSVGANTSHRPHRSHIDMARRSR